MGMLVCLAYLFVSGVAWWSLITLKRFRALRVSLVWWWMFLLPLSVGLAFGLVCGSFCKYTAADTLIIHGFPIPIGIFRLEEGRWVDYVSDYPLLVLVADVLLIASVSVLPINLTAALCLRPPMRSQSVRN
jgi:hypothetical protein